MTNNYKCLIERIKKLENKSEEFVDQYAALFESALSGNYPDHFYDPNSGITVYISEAEVFASMFSYVAAKNGISIAALAKSQNYLSDLFENKILKRIKKDSTSEVELPTLEYFKDKFLVSDYSSVSDTVNSVFDFMEDNFGRTLSSTKRYLESVDSIISDLVLIRTIESLSKEDLINYNIEMLSMEEEKEIEKEKEKLNKKEEELKKKYAPLEISYTCDSTYLKVIKPARTRLEIKAQGTAEKKEELIKKIKGLSVDELQKRLIASLSKTAISNSEQINAYNIRRELISQGFSSISNEDLSTFIYYKDRLDKLVESREIHTKALADIAEWFKSSPIIIELKQEYFEYSKLLSEASIAQSNYEDENDRYIKTNEKYKKASDRYYKSGMALFDIHRAIYTRARKKENEAYDRMYGAKIRRSDCLNSLNESERKIKDIIIDLFYSFRKDFPGLDDIRLTIPTDSYPYLFKSGKPEALALILETIQNQVVNDINNSLEKLSSDISDSLEKIHSALSSMNSSIKDEDISITFVNGLPIDKFRVVRKTQFSTSEETFRLASYESAKYNNLSKNEVAAKVKILKANK